MLAPVAPSGTVTAPPVQPPVAAPTPGPPPAPTPAPPPSPTTGSPPSPTPVGPRPPIVDCVPEGEEDPEAEDDFSCCTEERLAEVERMVQNQNREARECDAVGRLRHYAACPTFFARGFLAVVEGCFQEATRRAQDRYLSRLSSEPAAAAREQELRRRFDAAMTATIELLGATEPSTGDFRASVNGHIALLELRRRHVEASQGRRLSIGHAPVDAEVRRAFAPYAEALCEDGSRWVGGVVPDSCEARVRGAIDSALGRAHQY